MTSQAQNSYTQPPPPTLPSQPQPQQPLSSQGISDALNDSLVEGLPSYFTLNYAQQAALFLANAAAAAAASASSASVYPSSDTIGTARTNTSTQKQHGNHMTAGSSSSVQDSTSYLGSSPSNSNVAINSQPKHSSLQPPVTPGKQHQRGLSTRKVTATPTTLSTTSPTGEKSSLSTAHPGSNPRMDAATAAMASLFGAVDGRMKDATQVFNQTTSMRHNDLPSLEGSTSGKSDNDALRLTPTPIGTKRPSDASSSIPMDPSAACLNEALLANQLLQSLSGAQMTYHQRQIQQHQQQQQQQQQTALLLAGLAGFPSNYLDSLMAASGGPGRTGQSTGSVSTSPTNARADQTMSNNTSNLAYAQAMMMAMAAACGGLKPSSGVSGSLNYDMLPFGPFGSTSGNTLFPPSVGNSQSGSSALNAPGEPAESFNDVLSFLTQCLNNSKNIPDRPVINNNSTSAITTRPSPMEHKSFPSSPSMPRRTGRAGSTSRTRTLGSTQNSSWESHVVPAPTRHRGRGRPPKSAVAHYQSQMKHQQQQQSQQSQPQSQQQQQQFNQQSHLPSGSLSKLPDDSETFPLSVDSTVSSSYGSRRPSSTTSASDCSIDDTIEEVLRHLAACDHDPAVVASRYASSCLGMALNRKRRKEPVFHSPAPSTQLTSKSDGGSYRTEPGELYSHSGGKRLRSGPSAESGLRLPLALGWRRETLVKGIGPGGILGEVIYVTPCGRRLWNLDSVREYLKTNNVTMLSVDDFSFKSYFRLGDYYECSRTSQVPQSYVKMSEAALNALTSAGLTEIGMEPKAASSGSRWSSSVSYYDHLRLDKDSHPTGDQLTASNVPPRGCSSTSNSTSLPAIQPPAAHVHNTTTSPMASSITTPTTTAASMINNTNLDLSSFPVPGTLYTNSVDRPYPTYQPGCALNGEQQMIVPPPAAHTPKDLSSKTPLPHSTTTPLDSLHPFYPHPSLCPYVAPGSFSWPSNMTPGATIGVDTPWAALNRPMGLIPSPGFMLGSSGLASISPVMERDCMKNFFIQLAKEQIRLDEEKKAQRQRELLEERAHLLSLRVKEQLDQELKKPVNDLQLLNLRPLPELEPIRNNRLSSKAFTNCLVVLEFLHAFTEILCIDSETIPTMGVLQAGLLDREPTCQRVVLHLLIELLKFAILDPGLPSSRLVTQLLGQRFSELEVNEFTVTGLLRVFLIGRNGFEDDMSDWLRPPAHFTDLSADQQAALLSFVCDELVGSSRLISTEVDRTIELQAALKREKWVLESKVRRLRFLMLRKFGVCGPNESGDNYPQISQPLKSAIPTSTTNDHGAGDPVSTTRPTDYSATSQLVDEASHSPVVASEDMEGEPDSNAPMDNDSNNVNNSSNELRNGGGAASSKSNADPSVGSNDSSTVGSANGTSGAVSGKKPTTITILSGSAAPNASATATAAVSAAAMATAFLSGDEDEVEDISQLEARIETLTQVVEYKQRAIEECAYRLSGLFLGQDRFYRRYYILGHLGGIYVEGHAVSQSSLKTIDRSISSESESQNVNSASTKTPKQMDLNENEVFERSSGTVGESDDHLLIDYQLDEDTDARLGFDPDQIVALIRAHHELADTRRYKINLPSSSMHGSSASTSSATTHHNHSHTHQSHSTISAPQSGTPKVMAAPELVQSPAEKSPSDESGIVTSAPSESSAEKPTPSIDESMSEIMDPNVIDPPPSAELETAAQDLPRDIQEDNDEARSGSLSHAPTHEGALARFVSEIDGQELSELQYKPDSPRADLKKISLGINVSKGNDETVTQENVQVKESSVPVLIEHTAVENFSESNHLDDEFNPEDVPGGRKEQSEAVNSQNVTEREELASDSSEIVRKREDVVYEGVINSMAGQHEVCTAEQKQKAGLIHTDVPWKCEDLMESVQNDALDLNVKEKKTDEDDDDDAVKQEDSTTAVVTNLKTDHCTNVQPLDLSTKSVSDAHDPASDVKPTHIPESPEAGFAFITSLGLDDVALTTAALLFMTHTSIIPASVACSDTLFEPWKSIIAHYKSILIWALMEELRVDGSSDLPDKSHVGETNEDQSTSVGPTTLRDAVLLLKKSFVEESNTSSSNTDSDLFDGCPQSISDSEVDNLISQELKARRIQNERSQAAVVKAVIGSEQEGGSAKPITGWYRLTDPAKLHDLVHALASRGMRERNLAKAFKRAEELVEPSLKVACDTTFEFDAPSNEPGTTWETRFLRVRSRRGKGRGGTGGNAGCSNTSTCLLATSQNLPASLVRPGSQSCLNESVSSMCARQLDSSDYMANSACPSPSSVSTEFPWASEENSVGPSSTVGSNGPTTSSSLGGVTILESRLRRRPNHGGSRPDASQPPMFQSVADRMERRPSVSSALKNGDSHTNGRTLAELSGSSDSSFLAECNFLEEVESLEDRVLSASLQVKGWQAPVKVLDDETIHLIPRTTPKRSRFEHWPLDLARNRLLGLESHLERRYLLPPLNTEVHLDVVPEAETTTGAVAPGCSGTVTGSVVNTGENSRSGMCDMVEAETESESGTGGPGSEGTGPKEPCDTVHHPQIRRVVGKQPISSASASDLNPFGTAGIYSPFGSYGSDLQDASSYLFGTYSTENLPPGLVDWRHRLHRATDIDSMRACMDQLNQAIAWDKSIMKVLCQICRRDNNEAQLLLCDGCDHGYHTYCFRPPLVNIPAGDWFCYDCVSKATGKPHCFVCGGTQTNGPSLCWTTNVTTTTNGSGDNSRLVTCEQCSRAVHGCCARPPMTRLPRRWICPTCTTSTGRAKPKSAISSATSVSGDKQTTSGKNARSADQDTDSNQEGSSSQHSKESKKPRLDSSKGKIHSTFVTQNVTKSESKSKSVSPSNTSASVSSSVGSHSSKKSKTSSASKVSGKSRPFVTGLLLSKMKKSKQNKQKSSKHSDPAVSPEHERNPLKKFKLSSKLSLSDRIGTVSKKNTAELADLAYAYSGSDSNEGKGSRSTALHLVPGSGSTIPSLESLAPHRSQSDSLLSDDALFDSNSCSRDSSQTNETGSRKDISREPKEPMSSQELMWCRMATEDLINHDASWAFRKPVNVKQVPFYRKIIKHPMDLSTIQRKTRDPSSYSSFSEWLSDVRLIFNNCEIFNEDDSEVGRAGHTMRAYFESHWARMPEPLPGTTMGQVKLCESSEPGECVPSTSLTTEASPPVTSDSEAETTGLEMDIDIPLPQQDSKCSVVSDSEPIPSNMLSQSHPVSAPPPLTSSSPTRSVDSSDSHSSGFSGFEQNEYMLGLPLDDDLSLHVTQSSSQTDAAISYRTRSPPSTMASEVCVPAATNSSQFK